MRAPVSPLDEPYFGSSATANYEIPVWVKVEELTPEEKVKYDEEEKKREEQRAIWAKELAERTAKEEEEKRRRKFEEGDKSGNSDDDETGTSDGGEVLPERGKRVKLSSLVQSIK